MTLLLTMLLFVSVITNVVFLVRRKKLPKVQGAIDTYDTKQIVSSDRHKLKQTFHDLRNTKTKQDYFGWHYSCTCGTIAPAKDNPNSVGSGSESGAIKAWHAHAVMYAELVDAGETKLEAAKRELEEYKASCFCHDIEGN